MNIDKDKLKELRKIRITTLLGVKDFGRNIFIKCPLHNERSASFVVFPDGGFKCFGCGAKGSNAIDLLMAMGATFGEAIEELTKYK